MTTTPINTSETKDPKIALEQYRNIIGYLQYENSTFWTRSGFMLVAHSALLGFLTRLLPEPVRDAPWLSITLSISISVVGLVLSLLWTRAIDGALWWIERWHRILVAIEPDAYGSTDVFRGAVGDDNQVAPHKSTRTVAKDVARIFRLAWIVAIVYTIGVTALKFA